jgi:hypothetical protein
MLRTGFSAGRRLYWLSKRKVYLAVRDERFYILSHPQWKEAIRTRMEAILQEWNPTVVPVV